MSTTTKPANPRLTAEQKRLLRVAVAKDVIKSLKLVTVSRGTWVDYGGKIPELALQLQGNSKKIAHAIKQNCKVCGIGACFLSLVELDNKFDFNNFYIPQEKMFTRLKQVFSKEQIVLIENAFEMGRGGLHSYYSATDELGISETSFARLENKRLRAVAFGKERKSSSTERLRVIMKNIITNEGTFKP